MITDINPWRHIPISYAGKEYTCYPCAQCKGGSLHVITDEWVDYPEPGERTAVVHVRCLVCENPFVTGMTETMAQAVDDWNYDKFGRGSEYPPDDLALPSADGTISAVDMLDRELCSCIGSAVGGFFMFGHKNAVDRTAAATHLLGLMQRKKGIEVAKRGASPEPPTLAEKQRDVVIELFTRFAAGEEPTRDEVMAAIMPVKNSP